MKTSESGLTFIAKWEGEVLKVYKDSVGIPTIGVGHVLLPGESFAGGITHEQAMQLLRKDVAIAEGAVEKGVKVSITQAQFDALVSFTFNCGTGNLSSSTLLKKLNNGDTLGAADEFLKWVHAGSAVLQGLVNRRKAERELFLSGLNVSPPAEKPTEKPSKAAQKIIDTVHAYVGCSLKNRRADLARLVARGVDDPESVVGIKTNCATSALGIMKEVGVPHPLLSKKYVSGMAISWVRQVGIGTGALTKFDGKTLPKPGSLMRYNTEGTNNDHVEWLLGPIDEHGVADHGGGGRPENEITVARGNVLSSWGKPLLEWIDPDKLGIPVEEPVGVEPEPEPEKHEEPIVSEPVVTPIVKVPEPEVTAPPATSQGFFAFIAGLFKALFGKR